MLVPAPALPPAAPGSHIPPAASLPVHPLAPSLPRPVPAHVPAAPPRSLPTPRDIHGSLPGDRCVPETPGSHLHATVPDLRSGTSASPSLHTGPLRIVPPSTLPASNIPAPVPLPQCTALL